MNRPTVTGAVEGDLDEAVLRRLLDRIDVDLDPVYGRQGKAWLRTRLAGFNLAAAHSPWIVLVDLDRDFDCAPPFVDEWLRQPAKEMCFRVVVRSIEAWIMADRERTASFLGVALSTVPRNPEELDDAKRTLINLARKSRRRDIREDLVPRREGGRAEGPRYTSRMVGFVSLGETAWRPDVAADTSESLRRCLGALAKLKPAE